MDIKLELGKKIRMFREQKGQSREAFCDDELELTVRQLSRIEAGESLPTLPKLTYISKQLSLPISHLINENEITLPKRYIQLKMNLFKRPPQYNDAMKKMVEDTFEEIYEDYYETLPEEEQLLMDTAQSQNDVNLSKKIDFGEGILQDYFFQIRKKREFSENDLLIVDLYFACCFYKPFDNQEFDTLVEKILEQVNYSSEFGLILLNRILVTIMGLYIISNRYDKILNITKISNTIMKMSQDFHQKPIIDMLEGKYWLYFNHLENGNKKYNDAILLAQLHGEELLSDRIKQEWEEDLNS
ncbi:helix-turn-helix domain-containing protein [Candidatus Enterococcus ikei]|uniref:Transcriptional regulator n=1 Tax=Candidatus Enterococcus ikei TaxID=2815326 RepID=A0ABS3GZS5_9ENTE|nr:XRE family transcriptional regulator [Enterococcus sp. DIV0869a]MBO0440271.1 transcriptional regulator [Enterococcus sp. DIV0869a]